jgi:hypothetical protein
MQRDTVVVLAGALPGRRLLVVVAGLCALPRGMPAGQGGGTIAVVGGRMRGQLGGLGRRRGERGVGHRADGGGGQTERGQDRYELVSPGRGQLQSSSL